MQLSQIQARRAARKTQDLHAHDLLPVVEIQNHTRRSLLGFDDLGIVQPQVKRICFFIYDQLHTPSDYTTHTPAGQGPRWCRQSYPYRQRERADAVPSRVAGPLPDGRGTDGSSPGLLHNGDFLSRQAVDLHSPN